MRRLLVCLAVIACAAQVTQAQNAPRSYQLKDNSVIRAEITSVDQAQDRVEYLWFAGGGSGRTARKLSDFSPHSQFNMIRSGVEANDIEGHVKLAEFAVDNGLIAAGKRELLKARDLANDQAMAPELAERIMDEAVRVLDGLLRGMLAEDKMKDANYVLTEIMAGTRITDAQKTHFTDLVHSKTAEIEDAKARERADKRAAQLTAERQRQLKPVQDRLQRGKDLERQALLNLKDQTRALNAYQRAVRDFESVQRQAENLTRRHSNDAGFTAELDSLSKQAEDEMITSLLSQASIYTTRGSFNQALGLVGQVLAVDSQNRQALDMRARIEIAANSNSGFIVGRGIGRIR